MKQFYHKTILRRDLSITVFMSEMCDVADAAVRTVYGNVYNQMRVYIVVIYWCCTMSPCVKLSMEFSSKFR